MAHHHQLQFIQTVSRHLCDDYALCKVLEIGSYDVNGSIRPFFDKSTYLGVDLAPGPGVDLVCAGDRLDHPDETYDLTVSCESFEHNPQWRETFLNMLRMTKAGGIVLVTCATTGRIEHGTQRTLPVESPGTQSLGWNYYRNLTAADFNQAIDLEKQFSSHFFLTNRRACDLYFVGSKRGHSNLFRFEPQTLKAECVRVAAQPEPVPPHQQGYPRLLRALYRCTEFPIRLAALLPEPQFQCFAVYYSKLLERLKMPVKWLLGQRAD